ncbi:hypothetical protein GCM10009090_28760 [[Pseudomonas] boreopolis]|uniref:Uncharacterized protein n=2 Tax=Xanthomonas boreopolis TaxID=86183 RepID=A0A919F9J3_9XANT|nr:hypothetical protein GCM10009090_28760 [[Pseudomonas] boreopolis]
MPFMPENVVMRMFRILLAALSLPVAATAHAEPGARTHYFELVNRAHDSVVSLSIAPAGTGAFREQALAEPLQGGGDSITVGALGTGCRYDLRFVFRDGRTLVYEGADACRARVVRIRALPRGGTGSRFVAALGR